MLQPGALAVWAAPFLAPLLRVTLTAERRPRGIAMRKLMCRIVGISCAGIALVVLEAGWLAGVCHRRARARNLGLRDKAFFDRSPLWHRQGVSISPRDWLTGGTSHSFSVSLGMARGSVVWR